MNKQLSINLFLAQEMGLDAALSPDSSRVLLSPESYRSVEFNPHTDKAQWAEVVLWSVRDGDLEIEQGDDMAEVLRAIAVFEGWREES